VHASFCTSRIHILAHSITQESSCDGSSSEQCHCIAVSRRGTVVDHCSSDAAARQR
jgi:hypothetical protein